jgi:hypothetical protein
MNLIKCPYCGSEKNTSITEHPYPYTRYESQKKDAVVVQYIQKFVCTCGKEFFHEKRLGTDMGLGKVYYFQNYKYGLYQFRDTTLVQK